MNATCTQRVVFFDGKAVSFQERPLTPPGRDEVLLKLQSIGLCSSDFHIWTGRKTGTAGVLGHEGAGTVLAVGKAVGDWEPGDPAVVFPLLECGDCADCRAGRGQICATRQIVGYNGRGIIADMQVLPSRALFHPPPGLLPETSCLVEPLACALHGHKLLARPRPKSVLILGAGPMGLLHALLAKYRGAEAVWLADPDPRRCNLARASGVLVDDVFAVAEASTRVQALTAGAGAEVTVIANSSRAGHELSFALAAAGGAVLGFASILDRPGPLSLGGDLVDTDALHRHDTQVTFALPQGPVTFIGAIGFDRETFAEAAALIAGGLRVDQIITARAGLEDVPALIGGAWQQQIKIVVDCSAVPG